jgi:hypothetical protein
MLFMGTLICNIHHSSSFMPWSSSADQQSESAGTSKNARRYQAVLVDGLVRGQCGLDLVPAVAVDTPQNLPNLPSLSWASCRTFSCRRHHGL